MPNCSLCCRPVPEAFALLYGVICRHCLTEHLTNEKNTMDDLAAILTCEIVTE